MRGQELQRDRHRHRCHERRRPDGQHGQGQRGRRRHLLPPRRTARAVPPGRRERGSLELVLERVEGRIPAEILAGPFVGARDVAEVVRLRQVGVAGPHRHQRRAAGEGQIGFFRREHRHRQRVLQPRQDRLEVTGGADHHQGLRLPVRTGEHRAEPAGQPCPRADGVVHGRVDGAAGRMHDHGDGKLRLDGAHRGGATAQRVGDTAGHRLVRLGETHRHHVVETGLRQRLHEHRGLGVGVVAPGQSDRLEPQSPRRRERLAAQHGRGGVVGVHDLHGVVVHGETVNVVALDQNQADGRRSHGQPEHRVHANNPFKKTHNGGARPATTRASACGNYPESR